MNREALKVREASPGYGFAAEKSAVPVGYKKTEVGVIPEDWEVSTVGSLSPFVTSGSRGWAQYYSKFGDLFVRITNMSRKSVHLDLTDTRFVYIPDIGQEGARTSLAYGDLLISITADIGIIGYIDESILLPAYINQHIALVRLPDEIVCSKFVALFLAFGEGQKRFHAITDQGAKAGINLKTVRELPLALPPTVKEQRAIATALSDVDALLEELDRLIAKKRDIKRATMQQLLTGQTRLPGFKGEWETRSLLDIADNQKVLFDDGDWVEAEHITNQGIRLVQTGNIGIGHFVEKVTRKYIYEKSFEKIKCKELKVGDILICRLAEPAGRACILPDIGEDRVITSIDVTIFRPRSENADRNFLIQFFSTNEWFKMVLDQVGGTTHKRISRGALGRLKIPFPHVDEQKAIASILSSMDSEIKTLKKRRAKTAAIKQAMMQELLTGRTRFL